MNERLKNVMLQAAGQMRALRRENEILRAKVETFHLCASMALARPQDHGGLMGAEEDFAWRLEREAELMTEAKPAAEAHADLKGKPDLKDMVRFTEKDNAGFREHAKRGEHHGEN